MEQTAFVSHVLPDAWFVTTSVKGLNPISFLKVGKGIDINRNASTEVDGYDETEQQSQREDGKSETVGKQEEKSPFVAGYVAGSNT